MSNVKIKANASGTADFTIQAPATNSAVTMTLPESQGTLLTNAAGDVESAMTTQFGRRNLIINGAMQVAQRGTSVSSPSQNGYYTLDRWYTLLSGATVSEHSQEAFTLGQTDVPSQFKYYQHFDVTTGNDYAGFLTRIEDVTCVSGQDVTLSFYAKGTNPGGGTFRIRIRQSFGSGGSSTVDLTDSVTLTSSWQRFTVTKTLGSLSGKTVGTGSFLEILMGQVADTSTDAWSVDITGVQLEVGSVATPFEHRSFGEELALCQRYYFRQASDVTNSVVGLGAAHTTGYVMTPLRFPVVMRSSPTMSFSNSPNFNLVGNSQNMVAGGTLSAEAPNRFSCTIYAEGSTTLNQGGAYWLRFNSNTGAHVSADAEL